MEGSKLAGMVVLSLFWTLLCLGPYVEGASITDTKSVYNYHKANLAMDGDASNCTITGFDVGPWWKVDLGKTETISSVTITGEINGAFQIRIGDQDSKEGFRDGFVGNRLCATVDTGMPADKSPQTFTCNNPRSGRILSLQVVDPYQQQQLNLCEVKWN